MYQTQTEEPARDTRVTLVNTEFLNEYGGRLMAGTAVLVDARTARKWLDKGIAVDSAITDQTLREQKMANLARLKAEIEELESHESTPIPPATSPARRGR